MRTGGRAIAAALVTAPKSRQYRSRAASMPPMPTHGLDTAGGPVVVGANWYRFRPAEHIRHELVASVAFVWVVQGSGVIRSGGQEFRLTGSSVLRLPWRHSVDYRADGRTPFQVGTIHVVPWHDDAVAVEPVVAFEPGDPLLRAAHRQDSPEGATEAILRDGRSTSGRSLVALASYAVERFLLFPYDEATFRSLGSLVMQESETWSTTAAVTASPATLDLMTDHVAAHIDSHLTVREVADAGSCSPATAERLFARYTGLSVLAWVRRKRMDEAAMLLRTTSLRAGEVARMVGYADPLYFSRVFRATFAVPPSRYAKGQLRP